MNFKQFLILLITQINVKGLTFFFSKYPTTTKKRGKNQLNKCNKKKVGINWWFFRPLCMYVCVCGWMDIVNSLYVTPFSIHEKSNFSIMLFCVHVSKRAEKTTQEKGNSRVKKPNPKWHLIYDDKYWRENRQTTFSSHSISTMVPHIYINICITKDISVRLCASSGIYPGEQHATKQIIYLAGYLQMICNLSPVFLRANVINCILCWGYKSQ